MKSNEVKFPYAQTPIGWKSVELSDSVTTRVNRLIEQDPRKLLPKGGD